MRTVRRQKVMDLQKLETLKARYERRLDNIKRELITIHQMIEQVKLVLAKQELTHLQVEVAKNETV
jgi:hypothetical protein